MTRRTRIAGWKALPFIAVAAAGLLWHVLACVESPMSFARNGDLAFTTRYPYAGDPSDICLRGRDVYRVMVLPARGDQPRVLEESVDWMISAPAFSPDGKKVAYLRIPLLTEEELAGIQPAIAARMRAASQPASAATAVEWPTVAEPSRGPEPGVIPIPASVPSSQYRQEALPPALAGLAFYKLAPESVRIPAQLVERRASDGQMIWIGEVELPLVFTSSPDEDELAHALTVLYGRRRPQYSPDGRWVYFCCGSGPPGSVVLAVEPATGDRRIVAVHALSSALSPDGKTLAVLQEGCLSFVRTDGSAATYVRWEMRKTPEWDMVWVNNDTVAALGSEQHEDRQVDVLSFVRTDGTVTQSFALLDDAADGKLDVCQFAISPNGKDVVVAFDKGVRFLTRSGTLRTTVKPVDKDKVTELLDQPTFTPDGKQVAFKLLQAPEGEAIQAMAIVFFSPTGKQLRLVGIPPPQSVATRPARAREQGT